MIDMKTDHIRNLNKQMDAKLAFTVGRSYAAKSGMSYDDFKADVEHTKDNIRGYLQKYGLTPDEIETTVTSFVCEYDILAGFKYQLSINLTG